ncbi:MAG TPA: S53 family peptidase [Streptosporangiaceae bacterium]|nr:S53 family peptidase [Streptosporangiaceae bacterium]
MPENSFVPLPGSERQPVAGAQPGRDLDESTQIEVTLVTRRREGLPAALVTGPETVSRDELAARHGTDPSDLALIRDVLGRFGLTVTGADAGTRRVTVAGPISAFSQAFGATLRQVSAPHPAVSGGVAQHRQRVGGLHVPAELDGVVLAVLGLDDRPQASPQIRRPPGIQAEAAAAAAPTSYTPVEVAQAYNFPASTDGTGHTIAIIELGGGFGAADLDSYFSGLGIATPSVTAVGVDDGSNAAGQDPQGADGEVLLDIEVAGAAAPGARQVVYFAPNSDRGFVDAVTTAVHASPTPTVVSISWGQSEDSWTGQARAAMDQAFADAAALGVTVTAAAGDNGSGDRVPDGRSHADFPASSPHVLACGGTSLRVNTATGAVSAETVWNDGAHGGATGGGVSDTFGLPDWQATAGVPGQAGTGRAGRGVPDVAGNADPRTGYQVRVDGQDTVVGGTSAVAPLWAALICRLAQATGQSFGLMQPLLYAGVRAGATPAGFRDITQGNNGAYMAGPGWDACTGLGVPDGTALVSRLGG